MSRRGLSCKLTEQRKAKYSGFISSNHRSFHYLKNNYVLWNFDMKHNFDGMTDEFWLLEIKILS